MALVGCGNPAAVARRTAARDHGCQARDVVRAEDEADGYWLNVCGAERLYRLDVNTGSRFVDQTGAVR